VEARELKTSSAEEQAYRMQGQHTKEKEAFAPNQIAKDTQRDQISPSDRSWTGGAAAARRRLRPRKGSPCDDLREQNIKHVIWGNPLLSPSSLQCCK